jgi:diguanylate cyclase (GGDEF)-like protein
VNLSTPRGRHSLRTRLLALVLVPLAGVGVLGFSLVSTRVDEAAAAARAERAVRLVGDVSAARAAVVREIFPTFSLATINNRQLASRLGVDETTRRQLLTLVPAQVAALHHATDEALERLVSPSVLVSGAATEALERLRRAREVLSEPGADLMAVYSGYNNVTLVLAEAESDSINRAIGQGLDPHGSQSLIDLQHVTTVAQAGSAHLPLYLGARLSLGGVAENSRHTWLSPWGAYRSGVERMLHHLQTRAVRDAWVASRANGAVQRFEAKVDAAVGSTVEKPPLRLPELMAITADSAERDTALAAVLAVAVSEAEAATAAQKRMAEASRTLVLVGSAVILALVLGLVVLITRWVTRPLQRLTDAAGDISRGHLVDVDEAGPREVRTVARALRDLVAGLRRIESQADAVSRGDLDSGILREPMPGPLGAVVHASVQRIITAIQQRESLQRELAHQAAHDALTELPNRAQALRLVEAALHRSQRSGVAVGLLFIDLDHFKHVNDTFGHAAGDTVLRVVAQRMETLVRSGDVVARLGGDEFVVLVEPVETESMLLTLAQRLIAAITEPIEVASRPVTIGASIGIAVSKDGSTDGDELLHEADAAAYRAKTSGRGRVEVFDEALRTELHEHAAIEAAIASGLDDGEFVLHYQPVVDVASGRLRGFEALIRWDRPGVGIVPPLDFIPVAESSSLISRIGRWVLREATGQLARWSEPGAPGGLGEDVTVAVNISGRHLMSKDLVADVTDALDASGLDARRLVLELTETVMVDDPTAAARLAALRALGVRIAIDDFGTGYTSIGQLHRLPVDTLKIDRSFVSSTEPRHRELVRLIVRAAHAFDLNVVAEGVEDEHQLDALRALDCDEAQGYLIARPLPSSALDLHRLVAEAPAA